jgi:hypothetical protein
LQGWWLSIHAADLDSDGKTDLILGNQGENYYLRPTDTADVKLWVGDFDGNGIADKLMTRQIARRDIPVFLKRELTDQMPGLKKQNLRHAAYATKTIQDLVGKDVAKKTKPLVAVTGASMVLWNNGNYSFEAQKLPAPVQFSSVRAIASADLNKDGKPDLLLAGNDYHFLPQFSRLDASNGHVLINAGNRTLTWLEPRLSGMQVKGQVRNIRPLSANRFLFGLNNDKPAILQLNQGK